jgi:hypothetical protein
MFQINETRLISGRGESGGRRDRGRCQVEAGGSYAPSHLSKSLKILYVFLILNPLKYKHCPMHSLHQKLKAAHNIL